MKTTIILLGLLAVIAMPANGNEFTQKVFQAARKCISIMNADEATIKTLLSGSNFVDKKVACVACCTMESMGAIKNGKIDLETTVDGVFQSHKFDDHKTEDLRDIVYKCKVTAEKSEDKCSVAGQLLHCFENSIYHRY